MLPVRPAAPQPQSPRDERHCIADAGGGTMAGMIKGRAKRISIATASAVFLGMIGFFAWRESVTFKPDSTDEYSTCGVHGTPLKWTRVEVFDGLVSYDPRYLNARKHFPNLDDGRVNRMALPGGRKHSRWRFAYSSYCTECEKTYANWSRMSPEEKDQFAQQPVRYARQPEFILRIRREKGAIRSYVDTYACSSDMLENAFSYGVRRFGDIRLILELDPGLAPEDAAPVVKIAEQQGLTNIAFRVGGKPSSP